MDYYFYSKFVGKLANLVLLLDSLVVLDVEKDVDGSDPDHEHDQKHKRQLLGERDPLAGHPRDPGGVGEAPRHNRGLPEVAEGGGASGGMSLKGAGGHGDLDQEGALGKLANHLGTWFLEDLFL